MDVSDLLAQYRQGDQQAYNDLFALVYDELHRLASAYFRTERRDHTLQPTALIHEAYLRMNRGSTPTFANRGHFVAIAATAMRQILVDHARARNTEKRGGQQPVVVTDNAGTTSEPIENVLFLDTAIDRLAITDARKARTIELHYFGGLTVDEIADATESSVATVGRDLRFGKAWLRREMGA